MTDDRKITGAGPVQPDPPADEAPADDTEGHALGLDRALAIDALAGHRTPARRTREDEDVPPLTKHWPRLREDRPKR
jgi:hypothetical protein